MTWERQRTRLQITSQAASNAKEDVQANQSIGLQGALQAAEGELAGLERAFETRLNAEYDGVLLHFHDDLEAMLSACRTQQGSLAKTPHPWMYEDTSLREDPRRHNEHLQNLLCQHSALSQLFVAARYAHVRTPHQDHVASIDVAATRLTLPRETPAIAELQLHDLVQVLEAESLLTQQLSHAQVSHAANAIVVTVENLHCTNAVQRHLDLVHWKVHRSVTGRLV
jgi:hypothetical protein